MSEAVHAGRFAVYVVWAYGISGAVLAALAAETLLRGWRWRRRAVRAQALRPGATRPQSTRPKSTRPEATRPKATDGGGA